MQKRLAHLEQAALRYIESDGGGPDQREDCQRGRVAGMNDVARVELSQTDPAVHGRHDGGIAELNLCGLDCRFVGADGGLELVHRRLLLIDSLLGNGLTR
jgi:hypothetical protein